MTETTPRWPKSSSPLRGRARLLRFVHAFRAAVKTAVVEWQRVEHGEREAKLKGQVSFHIQVEKDELDGGFVAECVDLPGCVSHGETEREAIENVVEAIVGVVEARLQRHLKSEPLHSDEDKKPVTYPHRHRLELPVA